MTLKIGMFVEGCGLVSLWSHLNNFLWDKFPQNVQLGHKILLKLCKCADFGKTKENGKFQSQKIT